MNSANPEISAGPRIAALWPVLLVLAMACAALAVWIHRDQFMDREEAQHVQRALETRTAAFGAPDRPPSLGVLFKARLDQVKPWYGWPYYLAVAIVWQLFRPDYDLGVLVNLLCLIVAAFCIAGVARRMGGEETGPPAAVYAVLTPCILIWSHLFGPTPFLVAAFAATVLDARHRRLVASRHVAVGGAAERRDPDRQDVARLRLAGAGLRRPAAADAR